MSKSFYDFSKQKTYTRPNNSGAKCYTEKQFHSGENLRKTTAKFDGQGVSPDMAEAVNKYSQMSQPELMQNLLFEVQKQKQNGTFDPNRLESAVDSLSAVLTNEQMRNIKEIIKSLK